ncbi:hypothetical protein FQA39_LY12835 [Lamprigera yunnana]|nr:hypothetical protein FQA39_LY12835 [Lamprigera yunnana]
MKKLLTLFSSIAIISTASLTVISCNPTSIVDHNIIPGEGSEIELTFDISNVTPYTEFVLPFSGEYNGMEIKHEISSKNIGVRTLEDYLLSNVNLFQFEYTNNPSSEFGIMIKGFFGIYPDYVKDQQF